MPILISFLILINIKMPVLQNILDGHCEKKLNKDNSGNNLLINLVKKIKFNGFDKIEKTKKYPWKIIYKLIKNKNRFCTIFLLNNNNIAFTYNNSIIREIDHLIKEINFNNFPEHFNIDIGHGSIKGYMALSVLYALKTKNFTIEKIKGTSSGSWCGLYYFSNIPLNMLICIYNTPDYKDRNLLQGFNKYINDYFFSILADDFYLQCNNKLFIHYSVLNETGVMSKIASNYSSNQDLIHFCMGSSSIPYITIPSFCYKYKDEYIVDGAFTVDNDHFKNDIPTLQIKCNSYHDSLKSHNLYCMCQKNINYLLLLGLKEFIQFSKGNKSEFFSWKHKI